MSDKDSTWKEAIETYFHDFLCFFFARIARDIDFNKRYEFLDKEFKGGKQNYFRGGYHAETFREFDTRVFRALY